MVYVCEVCVYTDRLQCASSGLSNRQTVGNLLYNLLVTSLFDFHEIKMIRTD